MTDTITRTLLGELVKTRRELHQLQGVPSFGVLESAVPGLMTQYADDTSGLVLMAVDTGREWTLLGSRGWVLTYEPPVDTAVADAVRAGRTL